MALRNIVKNGEDVLRKVSKPVTSFDSKLALLLDDMTETLHKANGAGLAAPQVGILRRICIIDVGEGVIEAVNPEIIKTGGKQRGIEGCLSCPNQWGYVVRPMKCRLRAQDRHGDFFEVDLKEMGARCACHEVDHLDGKLFIDFVEEFIDPADLEPAEGDAAE